jgi:hypothetical protein
MVQMSQSTLAMKVYENTSQTLMWERNLYCGRDRLNRWTSPLAERILKNFWNINIEGRHDVLHQRNEPDYAHRYDPFFRYTNQASLKAIFS